MEALISIIMPVLNSETYVGTSISSVINQTYSNWELLIINDGSKDRTEEIVRGFNDIRLRYFNHQSTRGVSRARNIGLKNMQGNYFCFLDADDVFPSRSLESRLKIFIESPSTRFVDGAVRIMDSTLKETIRNYRPNFKGNPLPKLIALSEDCFVGNTWMIKRDANFEYRFEEDATHGEDLMFYLELANQGNYDFTLEDILLYRTGHHSAMKKLDGLNDGYSRIFNKIKSISNLSYMQLAYLKYRITRIMFLSYLRDRSYRKAIASLLKLITL